MSLILLENIVQYTLLYSSASPCLALASGGEVINAFVREVKSSIIIAWFHPLTFLLLAGFYFPDVSAAEKYYNGSILEEEYEKKLMVRTRRLIFIYSLAEKTVDKTRSLKGTQLED